MSDNIFGIVTIITGALMTLAILLQSRGASLGAGFGSSGELFTTRRGVDKNLFEVTIVLAVVFVGSLVISLIVAK
jgi:preprotein translocase subunit SecG